MKMPTRTVAFLPSVVIQKSNLVPVCRAAVGSCFLSTARSIARLGFELCDAKRSCVSTTRVALFMNSLESTVLNVRIDLRSADTGVPQHFLQSSDVGTACQ